jgi:hypothetical protein
MLQRNLLYTGITRGKRLGVIVGQKKAIAIAVRNVSGQRRWSKLDEWRRVARASDCFRRELRCDGDGGAAESPAGLVVLRRLGMRNSPWAVH